MKSLEFLTDLLAMSGASEVEVHPNRVVQRTPTEPDFWFGNRVIFTDPPEDACAAIGQFQADFPQARHICVGWDVPNLPVSPVRGLFEGTKVTIDEGDALILTGPLHRVPTPPGITLRTFGPQDWPQSHDIGLETAREDSLPPERYREYLEGRTRTRQRQIAAGLAQWFGAFDGDLLVGDMGIVQNQSFIRYQAVQTRTGYRRRGVASALLGYALEWGRARAPGALPVIVADAGSDAGRLYRRAGFTSAETTVIAWQAAK